MKSFLKWLPLIVLLAYLCVPFGEIFAGPDSGYTLVATVGAVTTYNDSTAQPGAMYNYEVTSTNALGEDGHSNTAVVTLATTDVNGVTLNWVASIVDATHVAATGYKVYRQQVTLPNPPGALTVTVNP